MTAILHYLFLVRFRKLVSKGDIIAMFLIVLLYVATAFLVYRNFEVFRNYVPLLFIDIIAYHTKRSDIELLKMKRNYKIILFVEYLIYSLPFYLVLLLKGEYVFLIAMLSFVTLFINLPRVNWKIIKYPFDLFNIHWHLTFRRHKLLFIFPLTVILIWMSVRHKNENLLLAVFLISSLIACIPSFEREKIEEIKLNPYSAKKYLFHQLKNSVINSIYLIIPIAITICLFQQWGKLLFVIIILIPPLLNVLLKYLYFKNTLSQQIALTFFLASNIFLFGAPLLTIPFLYNRAIKTLNIIKTC